MEQAAAAAAAAELHGADWTDVGPKDGHNILATVGSVNVIEAGLKATHDGLESLKTRFEAYVLSAITQDNLPAALAETVKRDELQNALKDVVRLQDAANHLRQIVADTLSKNGIAADSNVGGVLAQQGTELNRLGLIVDNLNKAVDARVAPAPQPQASQAFPLTMKQAACVAGIFIAGEIVWHGVPKLYNALKNRYKARKANA
jgi:hypothetical protein